MLVSSSLRPPRVLIADKLSPASVDIFTSRNIEAEIRPGLSPQALSEIIGEYDGLAIRSNTKVTSALLEGAKKLRIIGRAGIGVDNVDIAAATEKGVIVMNTPFGNAITTAEHTLALMFSLARQIPAADLSTQQGKWEKNRFMGVEISEKTLGIIGCGTIGAIVANRALGLKMQVLVYDPFLTPERALALRVEKVDLPELLNRSDFITLHTPLTPQTANILSYENLSKTKKGVRIINCARGGLVDEEALRQLLDKGHIAGAAFDVFLKEPAKENALFGHPNVVCTPHLGAATDEAQDKVAIQIAEQISDYLLRGTIRNAVNVPSISSEEAPKLIPFIALAQKLGGFIGQIVESSFVTIRIVYEGEISQLSGTTALTSAVLVGILRPFLEHINFVSAPSIAKERGIVVEEIHREACWDYESLISVEVATEEQNYTVQGTIFHDRKPRIVYVNGMRMEAEFAPFMVYVVNEDRPGFIGRFASLLGNAGINIATFALGREREGGAAAALIALDQKLPEQIFTSIPTLEGVRSVHVIHF